MGLTCGLHALPQVFAPRMILAVEAKPNLMVFTSLAYEARNIRVALEDDEGQVNVKDKIVPLVLGVGGAFR